MNPHALDSDNSLWDTETDSKTQTIPGEELSTNYTVISPQKTKTQKKSI